MACNPFLPSHSGILMRLFLIGLLGMGYLMPVAASAGPASHHIRTLAASCAACHGYEGKSRGEIPSLAGMPAGRFLDKMRQYRDMQDDGSVMNQHAKGLEWEEIVGLAGYFACTAPETATCREYRQQAGTQ